MMETRTTFPIPQGEIGLRDLERVKVSGSYTGILYVVHPSEWDGDSQRIAQEPIQTSLDDTNEDDTKIVIIAPPQGSVYLREGTRVHGIRTDSDESEWVDPFEIKDGVESISLIGGNLELCLGSLCNKLHGLYDNGRLPLLMEENPAQLNLNLQLNAIYSKYKVTALEILDYLMEVASPSNAVATLLTTAQPRTGRGPYAYGEFGIINPYGTGFYEISMDGEPISSLAPKPKEEIEDLEARTGIQWIQIHQPDPIPVNINLITGGNCEGELPERLKPTFEGKLDRVKSGVLPKYYIEEK